jgi:hypothetical protein
MTAMAGLGDHWGAGLGEGFNKPLAKSANGNRGGSGILDAAVGLVRTHQTQPTGGKAMNRAYAFAAGVVVAGVGVSLFAGNPNPPAGPIGPTMVTLDQLAEMIVAQTSKPWKSRVLEVASPVSYPIPRRQMFVGPGAVKSITVITESSAFGSTSGIWTLYDAASIDDLSTPIGALYASNSGTALINVTLDLDATVTNGLMIAPPTAGKVTVRFRED